MQAKSRIFSYTLFFSASLLCVLLLCYLYQAIVLAFALGLFLHFLLGSAVDFLTVKLRLNRTLAVSAILVFATIALCVVSAYFLPIFYVQILSIFQSMPSASAKITNEWIPIIKEYVASLGFIDAQQVDLWWHEINVVPKLTTQLQQAMHRLWLSAPTFFDALLTIVLVPLIAFFLLNEPGALRKWLSTIIPRDLLPHITNITQNINTTLRAVLNGQATVAGILAILYVIGLSLVGLKAAIAVGIVAGICRIIPYLDVVVGVSLSILLIISDFSGWGQVIGVGVVFAIVQAADGMFITPRIMGSRAGLHPLLIILSILSFGNLFGFWGILFAIPVIAIVKVLIIQLLPLYQKTKLYDPNN